MKKIALMFAVVLAGFLTGCKTETPDVLTLRDDMSGERTDLITDNLLVTRQPAGSYIWLNATRMVARNGNVQYFLNAHYESPGAWLNIEPGESLILTVDGQKVALLGTGSEDFRRTKGNMVTEDAMYRTNPALIRALARAKDIKVRLLGRSLSAEAEFNKDNIDNFKQFVEKIMDAE